MAIKSTDFQPTQFAAFTPEVQAALKANDMGQNNIIEGGKIIQKDPKFTFGASAPLAAPVVAPITSPGLQMPAPSSVQAAPVAPQATPTAPKPAQSQQPGQNNAPAQQTFLNGLVGTRQIPGQAQTEYFNTTTGEGFATPELLADFVNKQTGSQVNPQDVFKTLEENKLQTANKDLTAVITDPKITETLSTHGIEPATKIDDPIQYSMDVYNKVASNLGLSSAKLQIEKYNKELLDFRNDITDKIQEINDDPWLTESVRIGRINSLKEKNTQKEANLLAYISLNQSLYATGVQQAQFLSNAAIGITQDQINFAQQQSLANQENAQKQADARFVLSNGQPFYVYEGSDTVYSTATGKPLDYTNYIAQGGDPSFANVYKIQKQGSITEQTAVLNLMSQDPGAGILPTDTLETAQQKYKTGRVYRKDTYIAPSGGGSDLSEMLKLLQIEKLQQDITAADPNAIKPPSTYQVETNARILQSVDELSSKVSSSTVGISSKTLGFVPGTPAYNFKSQLDTLKSNIAFGALTAMREASKTGGALGQISDRENQLLSATLGALDTGQSPDSFKSQLNKIKTSITNWNDAYLSQSSETQPAENDYQSYLNAIK